MNIVTTESLVRYNKMLVKEAENIQIKINDDFMHAFEWDYTSDLYKIKIKIEYIKHLISNIKDYSSVKEIKAFFQSRLMELNFDNSSNAGARRASQLRFEAVKELYNYAHWLI